ncbi:MAG: divalent-cation tolerance protein CutA [Gammaproteobacteria bacterium]|nr:divalent-cation tolerance protein CutA [Gammaproteobacteria bacterium]
MIPEPLDASPHVLVLTTCADQAQARSLAASLVESGIAACVQMQSVQSVYRWAGAIQTDPEVALSIKTRRDALPRLEQHFEHQHPYEVPELVVLPIIGGSQNYLGWIDEVLADAPARGPQQSDP